MNSALVYIVILNWNGWQDTIECVDSCLNLSYPNYRILIVDNGSTDDSEPVLRKKYPYIEFIQTGGNLGFAGGNNIGIRYALEHGAGYIWLLNNDTVVAQDALSELVTVAMKEEIIGIVGSKLYYYSEPRKIAFAGGFWEKAPLYPVHRGIDEEDIGQYESVGEVDFITGCSLLIKKEVIKDVGEMCEKYFLYWEDIDWNATVSAHGWKILFVPKSHVWHKVSASTEKNPGVKTYYSVRNRLLFLRRHRQRLVVPTILRSLFVGLRDGCKGQKGALSLYFKGVRDFLLDKFGHL